MTASWMTVLPAVLAVISRPSRIDTPEEISVPSVRVKRDTADFRSMSPSTGALSIRPSICCCAARGGVVALEREEHAADRRR